MKQIFLVFLLLLFAVVPARAQEEATPAAQHIQKVTEQDITERTSPVKGRLEGYLVEKQPTPLNWKNFLQIAIRQAVDKGVSANTIVLVLLFPLVAGLIAAGRHLLGFQGFGIFVPAMLAVALVATGIKVGLTLFMVIYLTANVARKITQKLKLQYLPRMALLMWFVALGVLGVIIVAPEVGLGDISAVGIFPMLLLILLAESFIEVQLTKSMRTAVNLTVETLVLALIAGGVLGLNAVQRW